MIIGRKLSLLFCAAMLGTVSPLTLNGQNVSFDVVIPLGKGGVLTLRGTCDMSKREAHVTGDYVGWGKWHGEHDLKLLKEEGDCLMFGEAADIYVDVPVFGPIVTGNVRNRIARYEYMVGFSKSSRSLCGARGRARVLVAGTWLDSGWCDYGWDCSCGPSPDGLWPSAIPDYYKDAVTRKNVTAMADYANSVIVAADETLYWLDPNWTAPRWNLAKLGRR